MRCIAVLTASLLMALPAFAQNPKIDTRHLDRISKQAGESVEVTLEGAMLRLALRAVRNDPGMYEAVKNIRGIYVRAFSFKEQSADRAGIESSIWSQITTPPWERIVRVKGKDGEDVGIFALIDPNKGVFQGLVILVTGGDELVLVNIVGEIDLDKLGKLSGNFGIPEINLK